MPPAVRCCGLLLLCAVLRSWSCLPAAACCLRAAPCACEAGLPAAAAAAACLELGLGRGCLVARPGLAGARLGWAAVCCHPRPCTPWLPRASPCQSPASPLPGCPRPPRTLHARCSRSLDDWTPAYRSSATSVCQCMSVHVSACRRTGTHWLSTHYAAASSPASSSSESAGGGAGDSSL